MQMLLFIGANLKPLSYAAYFHLIFNLSILSEAALEHVFATINLWNEGVGEVRVGVDPRWYILYNICIKLLNILLEILIETRWLKDIFVWRLTLLTWRCWQLSWLMSFSQIDFNPPYA